MVLSATWNNSSVISWRSVLLVGETGEKHRPVASHWKTITLCCIEYTQPWTGFELTTLVVLSTDCIGSCLSNYHAITATILNFGKILKRSTIQKHMLTFFRISFSSFPFFLFFCLVLLLKQSLNKLIFLGLAWCVFKIPQTWSFMLKRK